MMEETQSKRRPGNPNWKKGVSPNPGGGVAPEAKPVRKTLQQIWDLPLVQDGKEFTPRTVGEEMAWRYIQNVRSTQAGSKESIDALEKLASRLDGRDQLTQGEAAEAAAKTLTNVLLVGSRRIN